MNYQQLHEAVKNGSIVGAVDNNGKKHRFFISDGGSLCRFKPRSFRRGYSVYESELQRYAKFIPSKPPQTGEEKLRKEYRIIEKYKRMAGEASFTNPFIRDCLTPKNVTKLPAIGGHSCAVFSDSGGHCARGGERA